MRQFILAALAALMLSGCVGAKLSDGRQAQELCTSTSPENEVTLSVGAFGTVTCSSAPEGTIAANVAAEVEKARAFSYGGYGGYGTGVFGGGRPFPTNSCQAPLPGLPLSCGLRY